MSYFASIQAMMTLTQDKKASFLLIDAAHRLAIAGTIAIGVAYATVALSVPSRRGAVRPAQFAKRL